MGGRKTQTVELLVRYSYQIILPALVYRTTIVGMAYDTRLAVMPSHSFFSSSLLSAMLSEQEKMH